jgi:tRNA/tmRNA/rRNA uracil-C5-methylase (TrmA/RlmC/RlmD family)
VIVGETVQVRIVETKRDFARAQLVAVDSPAPTRRVPPCRFVAESCGGCNWQHIDETAQLRMKSDIVVEAFARSARLDVDIHRRKALADTARRTTVIHMTWSLLLSVWSHMI